MFDHCRALVCDCLQAKQSRDTAQEEVQKLTQESNEKIAQVCCQVVSLCIACAWNNALYLSTTVLEHVTVDHPGHFYCIHWTYYSSSTISELQLGVFSLLCQGTTRVHFNDCQPLSAAQGNAT